MAEQVRRRIAWGRVNFGLAVLAVALIATAAFSDRLSNSVDVLGIIATIFSILAGVLMAVISILGDPSMLMDPSWRQSYVRASEIQRKLQRNTDVFVLYILTLASVFVFCLMKDTDPLFIWVQKTTFFLTVAGFIASLSLPFSLIALQRDRLKSTIDAMRKP